MDEDYLLAMTGIGKSFPGVRALDDVHLTLSAGEIVALLGENGAGKSTLIKVLAGAHQPDQGLIEIDGKAVTISNPLEAVKLGIAVIYQEFNLVPGLTVSDNIFLGREKTRRGLLVKDDERRKARELLDRIGLEIDPADPFRDFTIAQMQGVEIAKALAQNAKILVMDEPSATLTPQEVDRLLDIVEDLKAHGIGIIYISHRLDEIDRIADRVTILRDGKYVTTENSANLNRDRMIELMVGRKLEDEFPAHVSKAGEARLVAHKLCRGAVVKDVSLEVRRGEILALTGLVGSGRTETSRLLFGADPLDSGWLELDGKRLDLRSPRDAIREGICLLTEDRKHHGLVLVHSVRENFGLPNLQEFSKRGVLRPRAEKEAFAGYVDDLSIKVSGQEQAAGNLSGGNQQKVVLAKWLQRNAEIIIVDEPTRGIDVGAKYEIYQIMLRLAAEGKAILMISSELPEVLGMADRILVMHQGSIAGEISDVASATQKDIMRLAVGIGEGSPAIPA